MDPLIPLVFFVMIAGLVTLGVALNIFQKWATHRLMKGDADERFMALEDRIAELEERVDFAEHALGEATSHGRLVSETLRRPEIWRLPKHDVTVGLRAGQVGLTVARCACIRWRH